MTKASIKSVTDGLLQSEVWDMCQIPYLGLDYMDL